MIIYPAIDIQGGQCVRLERGALGSATVFNADPADQARVFAAAGFGCLHVVDLDGAASGNAVNRAVVRRIIDAVDLPVQLGGGIRGAGAAEGWFDAGVHRVIIGTWALRDAAGVRALAGRFPGRVVLGLDARGGRLAVDGWTRQSAVTALNLAAAFHDAGLGAIIFTDIERDGVLGGVNVTATAELAAATAIPVIASGGVAALDDLAALKAVPAPGIAGVIVGRALYDGRIDPAAALRLVA